MRIIIIIAFIFCFVGASAQSYDSTKLYRSLDYGWQYKRMKVDSILQLPNGVIINRAWKFPVTDTASLSYRINQKLNLSDTSYMLSWYMKKTDTVSLSNRINLKVNYTDTASMLSVYLRKLDTASLSDRINKKMDSLILTTIGTGGLATLLGTTLNIPNYGGALTGYVPYSGATNNVTLGSYNLTGTLLNADYSLQIKNEVGAGGASTLGYTSISSNNSGYYFYTSYTGGQKGAYFNYPTSGTTFSYNLPVRAGTLALVEDTVSISNRINSKLNIIDTVNIRLRPIAGTNTTITGTYPNLTFNATATPIDTSSISSRINNAYTNVLPSVDSSYFVITKPNGGKDTIVIQTYSGGSGSSSGGGGVVLVKQVHSAGATLTVNNATTWLIIKPSLASLTITLPASPTDGQRMDMSFKLAITSLTVAANTGKTIKDAYGLSSIEPGESIAYQYDATDLIWYRIN